MVSKTPGMDMVTRGAKDWARKQWGTPDQPGTLRRTAHALLETEYVQQHGPELVGQGLSAIAEQIKSDGIIYVERMGRELPEEMQSYAFIRESLIRPEDTLWSRLGKSFFAGLLWTGSRLTSLVCAQWMVNNGSIDDHTTNQTHLVRVFNRWMASLFGYNYETNLQPYAA